MAAVRLLNVWVYPSAGTVGVGDGAELVVGVGFGGLGGH
jgi:hypothetical protein